MFPSLNSELLVSGLIGLLMLGAIGKKVFEGYVEARAKLKAQEKNSFNGVMSTFWDRDQLTRLLEIMDRIALALEAQAIHQGSMVSRQNQEMQETLRDLVEQVQSLPNRSTSRRRPKKKPQ